jgi:SAM-dependent methyltransferase
MRRFGFDIVRANEALEIFHSDWYLQLTARRLEHLASLRLEVAGATVLEVGAGVGDQSHYYISRGARVTITDARPDTVEYLKSRYPGCKVLCVDIEDPRPLRGAEFDVVHCYGLLYHVRDPLAALQFLSRCCNRMLLLESCVAFDQELTGVAVAIREDKNSPIAAISGIGCLPTRLWLFEKLKLLFEHVYIPKTQPNHEQFPVDWEEPEKRRHRLSRAIFIASRSEIDNEMLTRSLLERQVYAD